MRRIGVLLVLLAVMLGVSALRVQGTSVNHPMTLVAIGFVLLAAFTVAEMGSALGLPRVTGYILTGTVLGPSIANILSSGVVSEMRMFNTLALGLIATAAGLELDARQIARLWRTLAGTILTKLVLGFVLVSGALYLWETFARTLGLASGAALLPIALVFGALSLGTSPAIALAVTTELRSKGRLTDLVLGAAVLKDLVVVVSLAVTLSVARALLGTSATQHSDILGTLATELGASIGVGAALGFLLIVYIRYIHAEMLLFVAAMILVIAEVTQALHLELLLVFITAGFVVRNFSRFEHELMRPVQTVSLPVFVVFFTNAGAGIDLLLTWQMLPAALAVAASRAVVYYAASRVGGSLGRESSSVRRDAWLAYLPQAGVTLGLVGIAATELVEYRETILTLGMAVVAINLLVGPVTLRIALRRGGEVPSPIQRDSLLPHAKVSKSDAAPAPHEQQLEAVLAAAEDRRVGTLARQVAGTIRATNTSLVEEHIAPWLDGTEGEFGLVFVDKREDYRQRIADWSASEPSELASDRAELVRELFRRLRQDLRQLPETKALPYLERHFTVRREDTVGKRWRKRWIRIERRIRSSTMRRAPIATCARVALESRILRAHIELIRSVNIVEAEILADLQRLALGELDQVEARESVQSRKRTLLDAARRDTERALARGVAAFIRLLHDVDSPERPLSEVRYSATEAEVRELLRDLDRDAEAWRTSLEGARNGVHLAALIGNAHAAALGTITESIIRPLDGAAEASAVVLQSVAANLIALGNTLAAPTPSPPTPGELQQAARRAIGDASWTALEQNTALFRSSVSTHRVALELRRTHETLPQSMRVADARLLASAAAPNRLPGAEVTSLEIWQETLLRGLLPAIEEDVRSAAATMVDATLALREAEETTLYALEQLDAEPGSDGFRSVRHALDRAASRLIAQAEALHSARTDAVLAIPQRTDAAFESLARAVLGPRSARARAVGRSAVLSFRAALDKIHSRLEHWRESLGATLHRVGTQDVSRDLLSRYRKEQLDASGLQSYVARHAAWKHLPPDYSRLFAPDPLVSPRLFVAHRGRLETLVAAERKWLAGGAASALLVGAHGSGRTSLLNQFKLELSAPRVLKPEPLQSRREMGLIATLGASLDAHPTVGSVAKALSGTKSTVIVDDLVQWLAPDLAGVTELERFLDLVVKTSESTFWVVAFESTTLALFEEIMPVTHAFGLILGLESLDAPTLASVIEERHRMSGRALRHGPAPLSSIRNRIPGFSDSEVTWRVLASLSDGNLSRALSLWGQAVTVVEDDAIEVTVHRLIRGALPFVAWLEPRDQALLSQLTRFGPIRQNRLAQLLGYPRSDVARRLAFLRAAGLVEGGRIERDPARIPASLQPAVTQGLRILQVKS